MIGSRLPAVGKTIATIGTMVFEPFEALSPILYTKIVSEMFFSRSVAYHRKHYTFSIFRTPFSRIFLNLFRIFFFKFTSICTFLGQWNIRLVIASLFTCAFQTMRFYSSRCIDAWREIFGCRWEYIKAFCALFISLQLKSHRKNVVLEMFGSPSFNTGLTIVDNFVWCFRVSMKVNCGHWVDTMATFAWLTWYTVGRHVNNSMCLPSERIPPHLRVFFSDGLIITRNG